MQNQDQNNRSTIAIPEIAARLGVCEDVVYEMLAAGEIPHLRHGRRYLISRAAFARWEDTLGESEYRNRTAQRVV